jgi:hypothetical protein
VLNPLVDSRLQLRHLYIINSIRRERLNSIGLIKSTYLNKTRKSPFNSLNTKKTQEIQVLAWEKHNKRNSVSIRASDEWGHVKGHRELDGSGNAFCISLTLSQFINN